MGGPPERNHGIERFREDGGTEGEETKGRRFWRRDTLQGQLARGRQGDIPRQREAWGSAGRKRTRWSPWATPLRTTPIGATPSRPTAARRPVLSSTVSSRFT